MRVHPSVWGVAVIGAAALVVQSMPVGAQQRVSTQSQDIYTGNAPAVEGIRLGGWGSGMASEDRANRATGDQSIKVVTNGYYAGARIQFLAPKDLSAQKNDPNGYLEFVIKFQPGTLRNRQNQFGPGGPGGPGGGFVGAGGNFGGNLSGGSGAPSGGPSGGPGGGAFGDGNFAGGGFPGGGFPGGGFPGGPGFGGEQTIEPDTQKIKVALVTDDATFVATNFPVNMVPAPEEGWFSVAVPWVAFRGLDKATAVRVREMRVFGDTKDTFWIGGIRTTSDDEPITVEPLDNLEVSVGEAVEFRAAASGGISPLHYSWDFDKADGLQEDATGQSVVHLFRKPSPELRRGSGELQPYVVTLTVSDIGGAKKTVRREFDVIVNP